jgi:hypothetical protein
MSLRSAIPVGGSTNPTSRGGALTVLVVGTHDWAVEQSIDAIEAEGHATLRCHELGEPDFPCNALLEGRTCPLDVGFDVVLAVRARPLATPTTGEMGVVCGLRAGAPLVVGGIVERNPFEAFAARVVGKGADLVEALEAAVTPAGGPAIDVREAPAAWQS